MKPDGGAHLTTNLELPSAFGFHALATIYVDYSNTGDVAMPTPLIVLTPTTSGGRQGAILTLDQSRLTSGFWTSAMPDGFSNSVQFLASGAIPGVLGPGESGRVAICYAGWQQPWDFGSAQFNMGAVQADSTTPIDWASLKDSMRPSYVRPDAWNVLWTTFTTQVGSTWGSYVAVLDSNAAYLSRLGEPTSEISRLLGYEFRQADALNPIRYLASATDAYITAPGMDLSFSRAYAEPISRRYELGPLGRGWADQWQYTLTRQSDGTVEITDMTGTPRIFQPDSRSPGAYFAAPGDHGALTALAGGAFSLRETDGTIYAFRSDGKLDFVQDTNANRITCGYTGGPLTSLTQSNGESLTIAYNAAGRITSVTDSDGRVTTYSYDASK
jgi:YD repeat-containing protein